jgi:hypothetical protein
MGPSRTSCGAPQLTVTRLEPTIRLEHGKHGSADTHTAVRRTNLPPQLNAFDPISEGEGGLFSFLALLQASYPIAPSDLRGSPIH